jgi:hypothetical protein
MSMTANVAVQLLREGARVVIAPGEPLPELTDDEARDLRAAGALAQAATETETEPMATPARKPRSK